MGDLGSQKCLIERKIMQAHLIDICSYCYSSAFRQVCVSIPLREYVTLSLSVPAPVPAPVPVSDPLPVFESVRLSEVVESLKGTCYLLTAKWMWETS